MAAWGADRRGLLASGARALAMRDAAPPDRTLAAGDRLLRGRVRVHRRSRTSATGSPTAITASRSSASTWARDSGSTSIHAVGCFVFALAFGPALIALDPAVRAPRLQVTLGAVARAVRAAGRARARGGADGRACRRRKARAPPPAAARRRPRYLLARPERRRRLRRRARRSLERALQRLGGARAGGGRRRPRRASGTGLTAVIDYIARGRRLAVRRRLARADDPRAARRRGCRRAASAAGIWSARLERDVRRNGSVSDQTNLTSFAVLALRAAGVAPPARTLSWLVRQQDSRRRLQLRDRRRAERRRRHRRGARGAGRRPRPAAARGPGAGDRLPAPPAGPRRRFPLAAGRRAPTRSRPPGRSRGWSRRASTRARCTATGPCRRSRTSSR